MADSHEMVPDEDQLELTRLVAEYNQRFAKLPPGVMPTLSEREEAEERLDGLWPYDDQYCALAGWCRVYAAGTTPSSATDKYELREGISHGFVVAKFGSEATGHWAVGLDFSQPDDETEDLVYNFTLDTSGPYGLVPYDKVDDAMPEGVELPDILSTLSDHSDKLAAHLNDPMFYTLSRYEQLHVLDKCIIEAEEAAAKFEEPIHGAPIAVGAPLAYVVAKVGGHSYGYVPLNIEDFAIIGESAGLASLARRRLNFGLKINSAEEAVDANSGLCLKVKIDRLTADVLNKSADKEFKVAEGTILHVPISGQTMDVVFDEAWIQQLASNRM